MHNCEHDTVATQELDIRTPSSAVNLRLSSSSSAPCAPSRITNTSCTAVMAAMVKISSPHWNSLELNSWRHPSQRYGTLVQPNHTDHPRDADLHRALRDLGANRRQPSILSYHSAVHQPLQRPKHALTWRRSHPFELHEVVDAKALQLEYRGRQVRTGDFRRGGAWEGLEGSLGVETVADAGRCTPGATRTLRSRGNGGRDSGEGGQGGRWVVGADLKAISVDQYWLLNHCEGLYLHKSTVNYELDAVDCHAGLECSKET